MYTLKLYNIKMLPSLFKLYFQNIMANITNLRSPLVLCVDKTDSICLISQDLFWKPLYQYSKANWQSRFTQIYPGVFVFIKLNLIIIQ